MSPFLVGREKECAELRSHLAASGCLILLAGEAGAGKTTLAAHVLAGTTTWRGRADEWGGPAYKILAMALQSVAGCGPEADALAKLRLGRAPLEPSAVAAAVCTVLATAAGDGPAVLFLDDLQWADEASLELLPALADTLSGSGVALVGCYRSDELPRDHRLRVVRALLRRNGRLAEITVGRLAESDVRQMLARLLGAVPEPQLAAALASRADGLPFAVEELAFALRDGGHLAYVSGTYEFNEKDDSGKPIDARKDDGTPKRWAEVGMVGDFVARVNTY